MHTPADIIYESFISIFFSTAESKDGSGAILPVSKVSKYINNFILKILLKICRPISVIRLLISELVVIVFIIFSHRFQNAGLESSCPLNVQVSSIMNCSAKGREVKSYVRSPTFPISTGFYSHAQGAGLGNYMFQTTAASPAYSTTTRAAQTEVFNSHS